MERVLRGALRGASRKSPYAALGLSVYDAAQIAASEDARREADENFSAMDHGGGVGGFLSNALEAVMNPVDYAYGAGGSLIDSYYRGKETPPNPDIGNYLDEEHARKQEEESLRRVGLLEQRTQDAVDEGLDIALGDDPQLLDDADYRAEKRREEYAGNRAKMKAIKERNAAERAGESPDAADEGSDIPLEWLPDGPYYDDNPYAPSASNQPHGVPNERSLDEIEAQDIEASDREMTEETPAAGEEKPEEDYTQQAMGTLFETAHNTPFDPKSSVDKRKLAQMVLKLDNDGGLGEKSESQFALEYYREFGYV
tara:strand:- start:263 stop:1198 length:936 start_codon:yes stop_codon:yes gene_type:complete